jgi:dimethylaniline monooxygenase (N-oxide forming)
MRDEVCVVGAGGAGLAAGQALAARGIPFRILESRDGIGGMWRHGDRFAYDSLTSNTSRYRTSFRVHRMTRRGKPFVHHTEFLAYLESFADRFALRERVELGARVECAAPLPGGGWEVEAAGREPEPFRAVVGATGVLGRPRPYEVPGTFAGRTLHSAEYRSSTAFAGQDVVVVGMGASAAEIAAELLDHARSVTLAIRTALWVSPKHLAPRVPVDLAETRLNARLLPWSVRRRIVEATLRRRVGPPGSHGLPAPNHRMFDRPVAISDGFVQALKARRFDIRPAIERFDGDRVVFTDGSERAAGAVIFAIGYDPALDFLPDELVGGFGEDYAPLLRGVAHPETDGLFFVGAAVGAGALLPMFEVQAAWTAAVLAGDIPWPALEERRAMLAEEAREIERDFGRPHTVWRDRMRYVMAMEREVARARASRARAA